MRRTISRTATQSTTPTTSIHRNHFILNNLFPLLVRNSLSILHMIITLIHVFFLFNDLLMDILNELFNFLITGKITAFVLLVNVELTENCDICAYLECCTKDQWLRTIFWYVISEFEYISHEPNQDESNTISEWLRQREGRYARPTVFFFCKFKRN